MKGIQNRLFFLTIGFFLLGFIHITFSILGLLCFTIPFIQYARYKEQSWCKYYCPRAGYFNVIIRRINIGLKPPKVFVKLGLKKAVVIYFTLNLFFVTMSTIMVSLGRIPPIEQIRFLIVFGLPFKMPQLLSFEVIPPLTHLGYRVYSMMFTSIIIGSILGILYAPRIWCTICPVMTLTSKKGHKKAT